MRCTGYICKNPDAGVSQAVGTLREQLIAPPGEPVRLQPSREHRRRLMDRDFDSLFTVDKPIIAAKSVQDADVGETGGGCAQFAGS